MGMEHVCTQRVDSWVVPFETGSLKVSPISEGSPSTIHPARDRGVPHEDSGAGGRDSTHGNQGTFWLRKNLYNNGAVQQTKCAVSQVVISLSPKSFNYRLATHLSGFRKRFPPWESPTGAVRTRDIYDTESG